jgi:hypothetical protein
MSFESHKHGLNHTEIIRQDKSRYRNRMAGHLSNGNWMLALAERAERPKQHGFMQKFNVERGGHSVTPVHGSTTEANNANSRSEFWRNLHSWNEIRKEKNKERRRKLARQKVVYRLLGGQGEASKGPQQRKPVEQRRASAEALLKQQQPANPTTPRPETASTQTATAPRPEAAPKPKTLIDMLRERSAKRAQEKDLNERTKELTAQLRERLAAQRNSRTDDEEPKVVIDHEDIETAEAERKANQSQTIPSPQKGKSM